MKPHPSRLSLGIASLLLSAALPVCAAETVFIEAESLDQHGGWALDTSFTQIVGSPYLLAHGLGKPVSDAVGSVQVAEAGSYKIWVRTKDWVAPWKAPGKPGRFQVVINGQTHPNEFGTEGADWHWQAGGSVSLKAGKNTVALRDLTGFDGRCDALLLSNVPDYTPPEGKPLMEARKNWLNPGGKPEEAGDFDLVVVGGGYAGLGAAISAARQSLKVALIQDRFVLGGNGSSEIGVWAMGGTLRGKYPRLGEIVEEFADRAPDSPGLPEDFKDALKEAVCKNEKTLSLFLGHFAHGVVQDTPGAAIQGVTALDVRSGRDRIFRGKLFVDCTGHGTVGALAGAKYTQLEKGHMGMSNMWFYQQLDSPQAWPETPWALPLAVDDFPELKPSKSTLDNKPFFKGEWFWESGFDKHPVDDLELVRDWNLRALFGAFTALKTGPQRDQNTHAALKWVSHVGGPRESRLLEGDVLLTQDDIVSHREFPDGFIATTWDIDLHYPREQYAKKFPENPFISRAEFGRHVDRKNGYPVPYRCLYSKNVPNLFMAGRNVSVTHQALGTIRVMRTGGMMGELVGKAASLAVAHNTSPRGVYENHLPELIELAKEPGITRRDSLKGAPRLDTSIRSFTTQPVGRMNRDLPQFATYLNPGEEGAAPTPLEGIVVDNQHAVLKGTWTKSGITPNVGGDAQVAVPAAKAEARFEFQVPTTGKYEVRLYWAGHENRASNAPCSIERPDTDPVTLKLNQRESAPKGAHSLGVYEFKAGAKNAVVLRSEGADKGVAADALQVVPAS